ncbi:MAG TPA: phosphatidylglycerophosphatase A [Desulfobacterales bacterium]|nr:phosphatidylglycerophosphatase A [Desulfobacterales bacterium]
MNFQRRSIILLATVGYVGKIPFAPGTFGSIPGLFIWVFLAKIDPLLSLFLILFLVLSSIPIAGQAEIMLNKKDPSEIVIDEMAGIVVALFGLPLNVFSATAGFFIFRVLDIFKPFPIRFIERKLPGGVGIVMDDVVAGIYCNLLLRTIYRLTG